jgi:hypothetical protein
MGNFSSLIFPIPSHHWAIAQSFTSQQANSLKAAQTQLNTLAVLAVHDYLQMLDIATDLTQSDSWNPIMRLMADVADLKIVGQGVVECRPVRWSVDAAARPSHCLVPPEVWSDRDESGVLNRLGYIVVGIDYAQRQATLLGFCATVKQERLPLSRLQSLETFLILLDRLSPVSLSAWLRGEADPVWHDAIALLQRDFQVQAQATLSMAVAMQQQYPWWQRWRDRLLTRRPPEFEPSWALRSALSPPGETAAHPLAPGKIAKAKHLRLGPSEDSPWVTFVVAITPEAQQQIQVVAQLHPVGGDRTLPPDISLSLHEDSDVPLSQTKTRSHDQGIQLRPFRVQNGTDFQLRVTLGEFTIVEAFTI